jgi:hypothetical protein
VDGRVDRKAAKVAKGHKEEGVSEDGFSEDGFSEWKRDWECDGKDEGFCG